MIISIVGDISLHGINVNKFSFNSNIINAFSNSDVVCGNLENPITNSTDVAEHAIIDLKSSEVSIEYIKYFNVVSLCNNHIFDYKIDGFNDTVRFLKNNNISFFGAGKSQAEAQKAFVFKKDNNQKVAFIGGKLLPGPRWPDATKNQYGTSGNKGLKKIIQRLKDENYFVIYYPHWGYEYIKTPAPNLRKHAKKMINYGVDLIVGSHPHVLQGYEIYKNKYIFYSIGNFIFNVDDIKEFTVEKYFEQTTQSVILNLHIENNELVKFDLLPIKFSGESVYLAEGSERERIIEEIEQMSGVFKKNYFRYCYQYYSQTPAIQNQNSRVYLKFDSTRTHKKQSAIQKIRLMTLQGVLNRIAAKLFRYIK